MNSKTLIAIAAVAAAAAGISYAMTLGGPDDSPGAMDVDVIDIGVLLPATGDLSSHGQDNHVATKLALEDFNEYLESKDADWRMGLVIEDTQTDPIIALEKIQSLNAKGINLILGTQTSAELRNVKSYADSNSLILVSPSSTSPKLAIDDSIFRLVPDDTKQSKALARLLDHHQIKVVIPVYRADVWGDGLYEATKDSFESIGGMVDSGLRYSPEVTVFSTEASLLSDTVDSYLGQGYTNDDVAVLMIGFAEVVHFMNSASSYDNLSEVRWFGSDASSNDDSITDDPISSTFAQGTGFLATQFSASDNETFERVKSHVKQQIGSDPSNYAYSSYDSLWVLGLTVERAGSSDTEAVLDNIVSVASDYEGAIGDVELNEYGDLAISDYELWAVGGDGMWETVGRYMSDSDSIVIR